jgi:hypothetical protein
MTQIKSQCEGSALAETQRKSSLLFALGTVVIFKRPPDQATCFAPKLFQATADASVDRASLDQRGTLTMFEAPAAQ